MNLRNSFTIRLLAASLFCGLLLLARLLRAELDLTQISSLEGLYAHRGQTTFLFLAWNLFLAWIPFLLAQFLNPARKWLWNLLILGAWLLFFPNAPYLVTDLFHLKNRWPIPHWYDLLLLFSFAWTGLLLGFAAMSLVQQFLRQYFSNHLTWLLVSGLFLLTSYGVYLGRYQRWNSWDLFLQPGALLKQAFQPLFSPLDFPGAIGMTLVFAGMLLMTYGTLQSFKIIQE